MSLLTRRLRTAYHNCVLHPLAGLLWFLGLQAAGDWVHGEPKPRWWVVSFEPGGPSLLCLPGIKAAGTADHLQTLAGEPLGATVRAVDEAGAYRAALNLVLANR